MRERMTRDASCFFRFCIVGASNTLLSYACYLLILKTCRVFRWLGGIDYLAAQAAGYVLSIIWSFYWNHRFVFGDRERKPEGMAGMLAKTYASYLFTGLFVNSLLMLLWVRVFGIPEVAAPFLCLAATVPLNFILQKIWVFGKKRET